MTWFWLAGAAVLVSALWWLSVAALFSVSIVRCWYERLRSIIDTVMGGAAIFLGCRLALGAR
jgi:threonine/homoserine/homoserine lactone efflux protein